MMRQGWIGTSILVLAAAALGSDSALDTARSFTIPTACTDAALCASFCSSVVEQGRTESDFLQLAAYQLGPQRAIDLPPANLSMPAPVDPNNVYAGTGAGLFSPAVAGHLNRVYSPNLITGKVDVIDPETFKVIESLDAVPSPEHIVPSWDLQTLWVSGDISYGGGHADVMPIDPKTGKLGKAIDVPDSYNLYFTPDGKSAIMVAEAMRRLEFRDPHTMALQGYIPTPRCAGINHADFAADGSYAIFTCEFGNALAKIDLVHHTLAGMLQLTPGGMPQDIRVSPDGSVFFVADLLKDGLVLVAGNSFQADRLHPHRRRGARALSVARRHETLCVQPRHPQHRRGEERPRQRQRGGHVSAARACHLDHPRRRQPGHGQPQRRRQMAVALGPLRRRDLRLQHRRRFGEDNSRRRHAARPDGLAAARAVLARAHGEFALAPVDAAAGRARRDRRSRLQRPCSTGSA